MEVLKPGSVEWSVERECVSCHALLRVTASDLRFSQPPGSRFSFRCAQCHIQNDLPSTIEIPPHAKKPAMDNADR